MTAPNLLKPQRPPEEVSILVCAATPQELAAFWPHHEVAPISQQMAWGYQETVAWTCTGVGIPATFATLYPLLDSLRPRLLLHIGIAGAYPHSGLQIGDIVLAESETYGDIGFELPQPPAFRPIREAPFSHSLYTTPLSLALPDEWVAASADMRFHVKRGRGCTVNQCTGTPETAQLRRSLFQADFESMEGAAVAQIGHQKGIPVCEIRAISNMASTRDMRPENIQLALSHLRHYLQACRAQHRS
jgi:futalosine hydrolase